MDYSLQSDTLTVLVRSAGAELTSIKDRNGLEYLWQAKAEVWPRHAPVLFPIVGRLKDNFFLYEGKRYELGQHGFARDRDFRCIEKEASRCVFELSADAESKQIFPFDFLFRIYYELKESTLTTRYEVINPSAQPLLFSVGAHPGFRCPLAEGESFEDYYLAFESSDLVLTELNNGLRKQDKKPLQLKEKNLHLSSTLFDQDALVFENSQIGRIHLRSDRSGHEISMECAGWPYFGIWSKKGCREFVCLEPWFGIADAEISDQQLLQKEGIISLEAGKSFSCSFAISLR